MGGLVCCYFLEVLGGWKDTRRLITFGTPFRGSVKALNMLTNGFSKPLGLVHLTDAVRSFTSVYQLLPLSQRGLPDAPYRGNRQPTSQSARLAHGRVEILRSWNGEDPDGDGTVPKPSAVPIELSDMKQEVVVACRHASLQNSRHVLNQVRSYIADERRYRFRALPRVEVSLDVEDVFVGGDRSVCGCGCLTRRRASGRRSPRPECAHSDRSARDRWRRLARGHRAATAAWRLARHY